MIGNINSINISIFLPSQKSKEITFELKEDKKNDKELIEDLINIKKFWATIFLEPLFFTLW